MVRLAVVGQVSVDVLDGGLQDVELVAQLVERLPGDDQLGLAEADLDPSLAGDVVGLPAAGLAELARTTRTRPDRQRAGAPPAPRLHRWFCHVTILVATAPSTG